MQNRRILFKGCGVFFAYPMLTITWKGKWPILCKHAEDGPGGFARESYCAESIVERGDDVVDMLKSNRETNQLGQHAAFAQILVGELRMRR